jgi:hypothetical protein
MILLAWTIEWNPCWRSPSGSKDSHHPCDGMVLRYAFVDDAGDIANDVTP